MKKTLYFFIISILCSGFTLKATEIKNETFFLENEVLKNIPTHYIPSPNLDQVRIEDEQNRIHGLRKRVGIASYVDLTTSNSGAWSTLKNGDKMWQLIIHNPGAESLSFIFKTFKLSRESTFSIQTISGKKASKILTKDDLLDDFQQNIALCYGDEFVLTLVDKQNEIASILNLERVFFNYEAVGKPASSKINESESCEVNINCSEGIDYQDEKRGVALVYIVEGSQAFICTGSLVNNLALDNKPLFLTALHCGIYTKSSDMMLWKFYFNFESEGCTNLSETGTLLDNYITSCFRLADSGDNGGNSGSDFLLVQIGSLINENGTISSLKSTNINAYWNGWDASTSISSFGSSIHHPSGDIKKISTYFSPLSSSSYGGKAHGSHWKVHWGATPNGFGISEHGSSGSPLFVYNNGNSRIIGTLTGGSSLCNAPLRPDIFGKLTYHWQSNGGTSKRQLKTYLDPLNTGVYILNGSSDPVTFAKNQNFDNDIKIYPNPTSDILNIDLVTIPFQLVDIEISDMTGIVILSSKYSTGIIVNLNLVGIEKGIYQIRIQSKQVKLIQRFLKI